MSQLHLLAEKAEPELASERQRGGPPNRMNDLPYRDWMKFQKSFFRHASDCALIRECIEFFTKATWPGGSNSRSLVIGFEHSSWPSILAPRHVEFLKTTANASSVAHELKLKAKAGELFDFVIIDLRCHIGTKEALSHFLATEARTFFSSLRKILHPKRYCSIITSHGKHNSTGFPIPWAIAEASRASLLLRDEKIGLVESEGSTYYCLFMQAVDDKRQSNPTAIESICVAKASHQIPSWVIPKPPPRKKDEILHPAKYPETLVETFVDLFSKPGDSVIDPMVGTGSTVIAALRKRRSGFGIDLSAEFARIAAARVRAEQDNSLTLFSSPDERSSAQIVQGDATNLKAIKELAGQHFRCAITSPPYWSMLTNPGGENQAARRGKNLPLVYSDSKSDLGNVDDYNRFLELLQTAYTSLAEKLVPEGTLTVVVKNVKREHVLYTLAWDLTSLLCSREGKYDYIGTTFWCQDDVPLKPFAIGIHWVSNILHHYCLHFQKRKRAS
jgi:hypothetical protein